MVCECKIIWVLLCTLISNSAYGLIAPFLPPVFKEKGLSGELIGLMIGAYSIAVMLCSPFIGRLMKWAGNTNMIATGLLVMGLAFLGFGVIDLVQSDLIIASAGFLLRFLQGASSACI